MHRYVAPLFLVVTGAFAWGDDPAKDPPKKDTGALQLKIVLKKDKYELDAGGQTAAEYRKNLEDIQAQLKKDGGAQVKLPKPPSVDLVLQIVNTGDKDLAIFVGGDPNQHEFNLKGPGVIALKPPLAFTADFRLPKQVELAAGKAYDIPIKQLSDGFRGVSRNVYWTAPGEYTLTATYQIANREGAKGPVLTSAPVKLKVVEK